MTAIRQGSTYIRSFILVESADHISPLLGGSPTVQLSKAGGPFIIATGTVREIGNGWYSVALSALDTDTPGELGYHVTAPGADNSDFADQILATPIIPVPPPCPPVPKPGVIQPTLFGFMQFVRNVVGISPAILPDDSIYWGWALSVALAIVNPQLKAAGALPSRDLAGGCLIPPGYSIYSTAVFNLAADNLFNYAQDLPNAPTVPGSKPKLPFFAWSRKQWNIFGFVAGVIDSSGDESTNQHMVVQEAAKNFTLADLQNLKTPYGRTYLALAQAYGPNTWGMN